MSIKTITDVVNDASLAISTTVSKQLSLVPYDPSWPNVFHAESVVIGQALSDGCLAVHHVGSTSVPGLCAKAKIDIIAVVGWGQILRSPTGSGWKHLQRVMEYSFWMGNDQTPPLQN